MSVRRGSRCPGVERDVRAAPPLCPQVPGSAKSPCPLVPAPPGMARPQAAPPGAEGTKTALCSGDRDGRERGHRWGVGDEEGTRGWREGARTELGTGMGRGCRTRRGGAGTGEGGQGWRRGAGMKMGGRGGVQCLGKGAGSGEDAQGCWGVWGRCPAGCGGPKQGWAWGGGLGFPPGAGSPAQEILPGSLSSPSLCSWDF